MRDVHKTLKARSHCYENDNFFCSPLSSQFHCHCHNNWVQNPFHDNMKIIKIIPLLSQCERALMKSQLKIGFQCKNKMMSQVFRMTHLPTEYDTFTMVVRRFGLCIVTILSLKKSLRSETLCAGNRHCCAKQLLTQCRGVL